MQIYLDYSATTPPRPEVITAMQNALTQEWGNPSSLHLWGQQAAMLVEQARNQVAGLINAPSDAVVFTSGGTEADNLAIMGVAQNYRSPQHIIISSVEHSAVAEPVRLLEQWGWQVTRLPVNVQGRVNPDDLQAALQPNTVLVSIIYGQSEIGTLQPIEALGKIVRDYCKGSVNGDSAALLPARNQIIFHTDAVQVAGRLPIDVQQLPVDLLSLSSHKFYGPQGAGALYVRPGVELVPILSGGGQESRLRSGTQAVAAIAGFGVAAQLAASEMATEMPRLISLRNRFFEQLADTTSLIATGDRLHRLPHHASFAVLGDGHNVTGKTLVRQLNFAGIGISAGSACHSGKLSPSPILLAMGYSDLIALGGIRLTVGRDTTEADVDWTAMVLKQVLERLMPPILSTV
jgi:cysteine desulfurase